jgi:hypothetical protein
MLSSGVAGRRGVTRSTRPEGATRERGAHRRSGDQLVRQVVLRPFEGARVVDHGTHRISLSGPVLELTQMTVECLQA